jgi:hypothetical protein
VGVENENAIEKVLKNGWRAGEWANAFKNCSFLKFIEWKFISRIWLKMLTFFA